MIEQLEQSNSKEKIDTATVKKNRKTIIKLDSYHSKLWFEKQRTTMGNQVVFILPNGKRLGGKH